MSRTEYPKLGTEHPRTPLSTANQWDNMGSQTQRKILCHQIPQKFNNRAQQKQRKQTDNTSTDSAIKRKKNPDGMSQTNEDSRKRKGRRKKIRRRRTEGTRQQARQESRQLAASWKEAAGEKEASNEELTVLGNKIER